jgi:hypothetical protein
VPHTHGKIRGRTAVCIRPLFSPHRIADSARAKLLLTTRPVSTSAACVFRRHIPFTQRTGSKHETQGSHHGTLNKEPERVTETLENRYAVGDLGRALHHPSRPPCIHDTTSLRRLTTFPSNHRHSQHDCGALLSLYQFLSKVQCLHSVAHY